MTVFHDAAMALFDDDNLGLDAIYRPPFGDEVSCRVIDRRFEIPQSEWDEVIHRRLEYGFRLAEVVPVRGAILIVDGQSYTLRELVDDDGVVTWWAVKYDH